MTQTCLIESIINDLGLSDNSNTKATPEDSILYADPDNTPLNNRKIGIIAF